MEKFSREQLLSYIKKQKAKIKQLEQDNDKLRQASVTNKAESPAVVTDINGTPEIIAPTEDVHSKATTTKDIFYKKLAQFTISKTIAIQYNVTKKYKLENALLKLRISRISVELGNLQNKCNERNDEVQKAEQKISKLKNLLARTHQLKQKTLEDTETYKKVQEDTILAYKEYKEKEEREKEFLLHSLRVHSITTAFQQDSELLIQQAVNTMLQTQEQQQQQQQQYQQQQILPSSSSASSLHPMTHTHETSNTNISNEIQSRYERSIQELTEKVDSLQSTLDHTSDELTHIQSLYTDLQHQYEVKQHQIDELSEQLLESEQSRKDVELEIQVLVRNRQKNIQDIEMNLTQKLSSELKQTQNELQLLQEKYKESTTLLEESTTKMEQYKLQLVSTQQTVSDYQQVSYDYQKAKEMIIELKQNIRLLQSMQNKGKKYTSRNTDSSNSNVYVNSHKGASGDLSLSLPTSTPYDEDYPLASTTTTATMANMLRHNQSRIENLHTSLQQVVDINKQLIHYIETYQSNELETMTHLIHIQKQYQQSRNVIRKMCQLHEQDRQRWKAHFISYRRAMHTYLLRYIIRVLTNQLKLDFACNESTENGSVAVPTIWKDCTIINKGIQEQATNSKISNPNGAMLSSSLSAISTATTTAAVTGPIYPMIWEANGVTINSNSYMTIMIPIRVDTVNDTTNLSDVTMRTPRGMNGENNEELLIEWHIYSDSVSFLNVTLSSNPVTNSTVTSAPTSVTLVSTSSLHQIHNTPTVTGQYKLSLSSFIMSSASTRITPPMLLFKIQNSSIWGSIKVGYIITCKKLSSPVLDLPPIPPEEVVNTVEESLQRAKDIEEIYTQGTVLLKSIHEEWQDSRTLDVSNSSSSVIPTNITSYSNGILEQLDTNTDVPLIHKSNYNEFDYATDDSVVRLSVNTMRPEDGERMGDDLNSDEDAVDVETLWTDFLTRSETVSDFLKAAKTSITTIESSLSDSSSSPVSTPKQSHPTTTTTTTTTSTALSLTSPRQPITSMSTSIQNLSPQLKGYTSNSDHSKSLYHDTSNSQISTDMIHTAMNASSPLDMSDYEIIHEYKCDSIYIKAAKDWRINIPILISSTHNAICISYKIDIIPPPLPKTQKKDPSIAQNMIKGHTIGFSVVEKCSDGLLPQVEPYRLLTTFGGQGVLDIPVPPVTAETTSVSKKSKETMKNYVFILDNTFSWYTPKYIRYEIRVLSKKQSSDICISRDSDISECVQNRQQDIHPQSGSTIVTELSPREKAVSTDNIPIYESELVSSTLINNHIPYTENDDADDDCQHQPSADMTPESNTHNQVTDSKQEYSHNQEGINLQDSNINTYESIDNISMLQVEEDLKKILVCFDRLVYYILSHGAFFEQLTYYIDDIRNDTIEDNKVE